MTDPTQMVSLAQEQLWFLDQLGHGRSYNTPLRLRLRGQLDVAALARSLQAIVDRHEVLRSSYPARDGVPSLRIAARLAVALPVDDFSQREAAAREAERRDAAAPFDLARGPLVRARLLKLADDDHLLLFTSHHIVSDGWSLGVFLDELAAAYAGRPLPALEIQYLDFAVWQRAWLTSPAAAKLRAYWQHRLRGSTGILALPYDRAPASDRAPALGTHAFALPAATADRLRRIARDAHTTLFVVGLATFQALVARTTGEDDFCIGTPVVNRPQRALAPLIGHFVETMALRCEVADDPRFADLVARTAAAMLADLAHKELPFNEVLGVVEVARVPGRAPLIQTLFELHHRGPQLALPGLTATMFEGALGGAKFDLVLRWVDDAALTVAFDYATDVFDAATIARLADHYARLLAQVVEDSTRRLSQLSLLTDAERHAVVVAWNATAAPELPRGFVHRMIAARAAAQPDAIAVTFEGTSLTYGALDRRANQLAHRLRARGVGRNVIVGVHAQRSLELVIALLAILKAGGAYLPLDPATPDERLRFMLRDSAMRLVLAQSALDLDIEVLSLADPCSQEPADDPDVALHVDDLAYVIYTSGSTGAPKAAMNVHRALTNRLRWMQDAYGLGPDDRVLQKTPATFDVSVWEFFWPLMYGARLVVARPDGHRDPAYLRDAMIAEAITTVHFVPSMLEVMVATGALAPCRDLVRVIASGEALAFELQQRFFASCGAALHNLYGPTEAAIDVSAWACRRDDARGVVPIGRPIANLQLYILDAQLAPVPPGAAGELYLAGVGLARGYLGRPALTAERFVPCPFGEPGARMYRTGDAARFLDDGAVEYLGRLDHQIKLRGVRIELGEIEHALCAMPGVRAAAVTCQRDAGGEASLVAHVIASADSEALRAWLEARLPAAMVPSAFVHHDALPTTSSGKLDRKALPVIALAAIGRAPRVAPATPTEDKLAALWAELLRIAPPGRDDEFFRLGGHSLLATRLIARVAQEFGVALPVSTVFEHPRLAALAAAIEAAIEAAIDAFEAPTIAISDASDHPLSYSQARMWLLQTMSPASTAYHMSGAVRIRGALDVARLTDAATALIARHAPLRTAIVVDDDGDVRAHVRDAAPAIVRRVTGDPAAIIDDEARRSFDLARDPLLRTAVIALGPDDAIVVLTVHHIACDGWSLAIMLRELTALYRGDALPSLSSTYADHARAQRALVASPRGAALAAYWKQHLADAPPRLALPRDHRGDPSTASRAGHVHAVVATEAMQRIERADGVTPFMIVLAAYAAQLGAMAAQDRVVIGVPIAGRDSRTDELVGCFIDTLALHIDLRGAPDFRALVHRVRAIALAGFAHQELPFERVLQELGARRVADETPVCQAFLNFLALPPAELAVDGATVEALPVPEVGGKLDVALYARPSDAGLALELVYRDDRYARPRMAALLDGVVARLIGAQVVTELAELEEVVL